MSTFLTLPSELITAIGNLSGKSSCMVLSLVCKDLSYTFPLIKGNPCTLAAKDNNLPVYKFFREQGCPAVEKTFYWAAHTFSLSDFVSIYSGRTFDDALKGAISGNRIETIDYLNPEGGYLNREFLFHAAKVANSETFRKVYFLRRHGYSRDEEKQCLRIAVNSGNLEVVKFLESRGLVLKSEHLVTALRGNHIETITYVMTKVPLSLHIYHEGLRGCNLNTLKFLDTIIPSSFYTQEAMKYVVYSDNVECIEFFLEKGFVLTNDLVYSIDTRKTKVLDWLRSRGITIESTRKLVAKCIMVYHCDTPVLDYLLEKSIIQPGDDTITYLQHSRSARAVDWFEENGFQIPDDLLQTLLRTNNELIEYIPSHYFTEEMVRYAIVHSNGYTVLKISDKVELPEDAMTVACQSQSIGMVSVLYEMGIEITTSHITSILERQDAEVVLRNLSLRGYKFSVTDRLISRERNDEASRIIHSGMSYTSFVVSSLVELSMSYSANL